MEIPVRRGEQVDVWSLRLEQDAASPAETLTKRWCIAVAFEIEPLGAMHARLTLQQERISASLWAEEAGTAELVGRHAEDLRQMFDEAGLTVGDILCVHGHPPEPREDSAPSRLINVEA